MRNPQRQRASVNLSDERVEKSQCPELAKTEFARSKVGASIGKKSGLFVVPNIIRYDGETGLIVFERKTGIKSLRAVLRDQGKSSDLVERCAKSLIAIHEHQGGDAGTRHGDFTIDNIFHDASTDELVILDWSLPVWLQGRSSNDAMEDVSVFLMSLFNRPIFYRKKIRNVDQLATAFLETYFRQGHIDRPLLSSTTAKLLSLYLPHYRRSVLWRYLANYPSMRRFQRFVGRA